MKLSLLFPAFFFSAFAHAQTLRTPASFVYTKLTAYSNQFGDAFSFSANQGALAAVKYFSAGVYSERRFMLDALQGYDVAMALPTSSGNFGLRAAYFGQQAFNESAAGLAYARNLGSKVALGVQFNYHSVRMAGYGSASTMNFDAGAIFHLSPQVNAGLHLYNPVAKAWGKEGEKLPAVYSAGIGYDASPQVFVALEAEKMEDQPVGVNAGVQYKPAEMLMARAGIHSATSVYYLGLGVQLKSFRVDVTASVHPYLGLTPGMLLLYSSRQ